MALPVGTAYCLLFGALLSKGTWASFGKLAAKYTFNGKPLQFPDFMLIKVVGVNFGIWAFAPIGLLAVDNGWNLGNGADLAFCSGVANMLGNGLMVAAVTECGLAVAFPVGIGIAVVGGTVLTYLVEPKGSLPFLVVGVASIIVAIVLSILNAPAAAKSCEAPVRCLEAAIDPNQKGSEEPEITLQAVPSPVVAGVDAGPGGGQARMPLSRIMYPVAAGITSSLWSPLAALAGTSGKSPAFVTAAFVGLGYLTAGLVCSGISTVLRIIKGPEMERSHAKLHEHHGLQVVFLCFVGGFVWGLGTAMHYAAASYVGFAISYGIAQCSPCIAAQAGLAFFGEKPRSLRVFMATQCCYIIGVALLAVASWYK